MLSKVMLFFLKANYCKYSNGKILHNNTLYIVLYFQFDSFADDPGKSNEEHEMLDVTNYCNTVMML